MKLALVGDVHGNVEWAKSAIYRAADLGAERIIFLGDFGYKFKDRFIAGLSEASKDTGLLIEWIDGNHEDFDKLESMYYDLGPEFKYHQRGTVEIIDGVRFMFLGGATSVDREFRISGVYPGKHWWHQESLTMTDVYRARLYGKADVILSHDAPYLPPVPTHKGPTAPFPKFDLDVSELHRTIYEFIYRRAMPKYVFHGHYHAFYEDVIDEPWGKVTITGLNCDGTKLIENVRIIDTEDMK